MELFCNGVIVGALVCWLENCGFKRVLFWLQVFVICGGGVESDLIVLRGVEMMMMMMMLI